MARPEKTNKDSTANLGFEAKLWLAADKLRRVRSALWKGASAHGGVQSEIFVESHGGSLGDISIYGQESNPTTRRLAIMNLALRGIEADFGDRKSVV